MAAKAKPAPKSLRLHGGAVIRFPAVMGVLNVTPDSFSDGGRFLDPARAIDHALAMEAAGAAIIDIGGESTRPGARGVDLEVELARVLPVIEVLAARLKAPISIDTRKAAVALAALERGAAIVNDISGLQHDAAMAAMVARARAGLVLMHMRGTPDVMMSLANYGDVVGEVCTFLRRQAATALAAGVARSRIIVDPGLGFAKNWRHNLILLSSLRRICALGYPVLIGASRKSFVRRIAGGSESELLFGTAAVNALAVAAGAAIIRVHDPGPAAAVVRMAAAIAASGRA
ncbi:MAG: dihydropteroate synthase [Candidatus Binataceae bacterium]